MSEPSNMAGHVILTTVGYYMGVSNTSGPAVKEEGATAPGGLLSDAVYEALNMAVTQVALPIIEVTGILANSINLVVFWVIGLNDSVTSSFFALSLSDLCYLLAAIFVWLCFTVDRLLDPRGVDVGHLGYLGIWYCHLLLAVSILITTYIAVQRCCCVAMPLKFKGVFTSRRNVVVISLICVCSVGLYIPVISHQGMKRYAHGATNSSRYGLWFSRNRKSALAVNDFMAGTLFPIVTQTVTVICMVILTSSLRQSSRFRQSTMSTAKGTGPEVSTGSKELQVVKAVTIVTSMFIASNVPPICIALTRRLVPAFDIYKTFHYLFNISNVIKDAIQYLNASLNIIVYYHFNSAYRNIFKQVVLTKLCLCKKTKGEN